MRAATATDRIARGELSPSALRGALDAVPPLDRDAWIDAALGLDAVPDDGPSLPHGCVPYLPCPVDLVRRAVEAAEVTADDVFVDVGAGVGRAAVIAHLLTGASSVGVEVQPELVAHARAMTSRLSLPRVTVVAGEAVTWAGLATAGTVYFLYCPFSGARLASVLDALERAARVRALRVCCVDLPLPPRPWLTRVTADGASVDVYRAGP